jgi:hypothetical protein
VKYLKTAMAICLYLLLLIVVYYLYIGFLKVNVVFYASLYSALIALAIFSLLLIYSPYYKPFSRHERLQTIIICGLLGYIVAISVPTIIDRSLSFYILEKLQQRGGAIQLSKFDYIFTKEYMREHRLVDVRLTEQEESGTIKIRGDCVLLTSRGDALASFSRYFRAHLLPKQRLLGGEYTDLLTDPFTRSDQSPDYLCNDQDPSIQ